MLPQLLRWAFLAIPAAVLAAMVVFLWVGWRIGRRRLARGDVIGEGIGALEAAVFALLGLLLAFSFAGAQTRLDARRALIVEEANAIGTAYLRVDLLPAADRPVVKELFRQYTDARIEYYKVIRNLPVARVVHQRSAELQQEIWDRAIAAADRVADQRAALLVVPALNQMIDLTTTHEAALRTHVPLTIFVLLGVMSLICAMMAGADMARASKLGGFYVVGFAVTMALTAFVILNLEFPRLGFVSFEALDALLGQVRAGMK
jgi:hypothetical protein